MARKIRQRSRKSQIITLMVAGGALLILHLALIALLVMGYIDGYTFWGWVIEFFLIFSLPFIAVVIFMMRDDLRRWRRFKSREGLVLGGKRP